MGIATLWIEIIQDICNFQLLFTGLNQDLKLGKYQNFSKTQIQEP